MIRSDDAAGRRVKLVKAASKVIHRQGFLGTTLAGVAKAADVPPGSVYYYFKTKEELAAAITDLRMAHLHCILVEETEAAGPRERLATLIGLWIGDSEIDARFGCPIGSLCYELAKQGGSLADESARPLRFLLQWSEAQFRELGKGEESAGLALHLVAALQGASLVANTVKDPSVIVKETGRLKDWLEDLARSRTTRPGTPPRKTSR